MEQITVHNFSELLEALYWDSYDESIDRFRSPFVFRGLEDVNYLSLIHI